MTSTPQMQKPLPQRHPAEPARLWLRRLAWLCAIMVLLITSLSAFIRLTRSGVGCTPWPACYGHIVDLRTTHPAPAIQAGASDTAITLARGAHRVVASSCLLVVLALLALALRKRWRKEAQLAAGLLTWALFLAFLGATAGSSRLPAVTLGHLIAGMGMWILSLRLAWAPDPRHEVTSATPWVQPALVVAGLQIALGGLVSSGDAGLSCPVLGSCDLSAATWQSLNPWQAIAPGTNPSHAEGALVHLLHRATGLLLLVLLSWIATQAVRQGRTTLAATLMGLALLQIALGFGAVAQQLPLLTTWAHNVGAALLLAALVRTGIMPSKINAATGLTG